jgi:RHS repeat-associated protein
VAVSRFTRVVDVTRFFGVIFTYRYDPLNRLTNRWTPAKGNTLYSYDAVGNLTLVNYTNSPDITLSYDALNRLTNMVDAVGTSRYTYTAWGALLSEDGPWADDTVTYAYTTNRLRSKLTLAQPNASDWVQTYAYDKANRLTNTTSPAGAFGYRFRAATFTEPVNGTPLPTAGRLVERLVLPSGAYVTNVYDTLARLTSTTLKNSSHSTLNSHAYDLNDGHQRTKQTRKDGDFVDYTYDPIGQLQTALGKENGGTTNRSQEQFRYTYDAAGNLSNRVANVLTNTFNVNSLNELTTVTRTTNFTLAGFTTMPATNVTVNSATATRYADNTFAKDSLALLDGSNTFTAVAKDSSARGDTNALTLSLPATNSFAYDLNGNMITNGSMVLAYDDENQLTAITNAGAWASVFTYDGKMRRRIRKEFTWRNSAWVPTNEVRYVYDGNLVVQERNEFNVATKTFTRGLDLSSTLQGAGGIGGLLCFSDHTATSTYHLDFHAEGSGNVTALVDRNEQVAARYLYDPFGNTLAASGPQAEANLYRFSGKEQHTQSRLVCYLYRVYDPALHRWLSRDPLGGWTSVRLKTRLGEAVRLSPWERYEWPNLYTFAHHTSINVVDPNGLWTFGIGGQAGLGFFGAIGISLGVYVGYSKANGWSFGVLGGPFLGVGGPVSASAGGFVQVTSAKKVCQLKGLSGKVGGSAGEGLVIGGDLVAGVAGDYFGAEINAGVGGGLPVEVHSGFEGTIGWDTDNAWR